MPRYIFVLLAGGLICVILYFGLGLLAEKKSGTAVPLPPAHLSDRPVIGEAAPPFQLPRLSDPKQLLTVRDLFSSGKVSLLNVWATWCVSCKIEHPVLMELAKRESVNLYGLNYMDDLPKAQAWLAEHGNPYIACAFDEQGRTGKEYGITGAPITFVIDKQGRVRHKHMGLINMEKFDLIFKPLLRKLAAEP
ncbi:MAG: DsbE family thiol:disulfide interchange protein [Gammaproteobacteria bacterium]|nr:DsbE family thiol:disulfide interchange protein [Gammaproteobacteria bacterium]